MGIRDWFRGSAQEKKDTRAIAVEMTEIGGPPELDFLFIQVSDDDARRAIDSWKWLPLNHLTIIAVSAFGEPFLRDSAGAIHQIDTIEGQVLKVANSLPELTAMLQSVEARDKFLFAGLAVGVRDRGLLLELDECYDFRIPPVLGGEMDVDEIEKMLFVVKLHIAGQLHEQVKDLPPGTQINQVTISS